MLIKHASYYLFARILPAFINFGAVVIYSRLLTPDEYGRYALVVAAAALIGAVCFQWLRQVLLRYYDRYRQAPGRLGAVIAFSYIAMCIIVGLAAVCMWLIATDSYDQGLVVIGYIIVVLQSAFGLLQEWARARLSPTLYGRMALLRSVATLVVSLILIHLGLREHALLLALIAGSMLPLILFGKPISKVRFREFSVGFARTHLPYGLPFIATFSLQFVINSSDRFVVGWILNAAAVGSYAVAYDLANLSLAVILVTINLAAYPMALRAYEQHGVEAARKRMAENAALLMGVGLPATIGIFILAGNISHVLLGSEFQDSAALVLPWIAIATLVGGLKAYHYDLAFQLGERSSGQVPIAFAAALTNVLFTVALVPIMGLVGAAMGTLLAMLVGLIYSAIAGRKFFRVPNPFAGWWSYVGPSIFMSIVLAPWAGSRGVISLMLQICVGMLSYVVAYFAFNPHRRLAVLQFLRRRKD